MKQFYILILCLGFALGTGYSQSTNFSKQLKEKAQERWKTKSPGLASMSPRTAMLVARMQKPGFYERLVNSPSHSKEFGVHIQNGKAYINAFVMAENADLGRYGFLPGSSIHSKLQTGLIPLDQLAALAADDGVEYVQMGEKAQLALDTALIATRVNEVHAGASGIAYTYTGKDVVVGVIDGGFDYTHPAFYDTAYNSYRVVRGWDQDLSGNTPAGYNYGHEMTSHADFMMAQTSDTSHSHGTHVAGTAAGGGAGNATFRGVAYQSDIVLVQTNLETTGILDGVQYIMDYAQSVGKPCVINMSLGGHMGPHDGQSFFDQAIDSIVGPGRLVVGAAGNEGGDSIHISKSMPTPDTMASFFKFKWTPGGHAGADIWGLPQDSFHVVMGIYNLAADSIDEVTPIFSSTMNGAVDTFLVEAGPGGPRAGDTCYIEMAAQTFPGNNKPNVSIEIDYRDSTANPRAAFLAVFASGTDVQMWTVSSGETPAEFSTLGAPAPFVSGSTNSTIGEIGGTGNSIISVGAYTTKQSYNDLNGDPQQAGFPANLGEIAPFSSKGPTADGRTKPDITAPGNAIIAPVNSFDANYSATSSQTAATANISGNTWYYGSMQGTSMSSPMVSGIMALWLQANPDLTPDKARAFMNITANTDNFTGTIPAGGDNTWGWGKIDAMDGMVQVESDMGVERSGLLAKKLQLFPNPARDQVTLSSSFEQDIDYQITSIGGQPLLSGTLPSKESATLDLEALPAGVYFIKVQVDGMPYARKLILQ